MPTLWETICAHPNEAAFVYQSPLQLKADRPHPHDYSTHRQIPWTDNDSSLLFSALDKAEPLISTATRQKFDFDLDP